MENKNGRERTFNQSIKSFLPATYPPTTPIALDSVPIWKSISFSKPKCFTVPFPFPVTPDPCASSTYVMRSDGQTHTLLETEKTETTYNHGAGCTFAAAITANLANGLTVSDAVFEAKEFVSAAITHGWKLNQYVGPVLTQ